jgi:hypothetical protein
VRWRGIATHHDGNKWISEPLVVHLRVDVDAREPTPYIYIPRVRGPADRILLQAETEPLATPRAPLSAAPSVRNQENAGVHVEQGRLAVASAAIIATAGRHVPAVRHGIWVCAR